MLAVALGSMASSSLPFSATKSLPSEVQKLPEQQPTLFSPAAPLMPLLGRSTASAANTTEDSKLLQYSVRTVAEASSSCHSAVQSPSYALGPAPITCSLRPTAVSGICPARTTAIACADDTSNSPFCHAAPLGFSDTSTEGAPAATQHHLQQVAPLLMPPQLQHKQTPPQQQQLQPAVYSASHCTTTATVAPPDSLLFRGLQRPTEGTEAGAYSEKRIQSGGFYCETTLSSATEKARVDGEVLLSGGAGGFVESEPAQCVPASAASSCCWGADGASCWAGDDNTEGIVSVSPSEANGEPDSKYSAAAACPDVAAPVCTAIEARAAAEEAAASMNEFAERELKMAHPTVPLRLNKRGRQPKKGAAAGQKEEATLYQQGQRVTRCLPGRTTQAARSRASLRSRTHSSCSSSNSSRSRSRSTKRGTHNSNTTRRTRKTQYLGSFMEATEAATPYLPSHGEWKKAGRRRHRGESLALDVSVDYTGSTSSSSVTPLSFVDMAYGSSSSSSREEALAATCREDTVSGSSSGGLSPSTCTDRTSSSVESPTRSSRCSGREDDEDHLACGITSAVENPIHNPHVNPANHNVISRVEEAAVTGHAAVAEVQAIGLNYGPPSYTAAYSAASQETAGHHAMSEDSNRKRSEQGAGFNGGDSTVGVEEEGGREATADVGEEEDEGGSKRPGGRLLRKRTAAGTQCTDTSSNNRADGQQLCRTSGRRRRTTAAAAAARGEDSCWVYEPPTTYARGTRGRTRGSAALTAAAGAGAVRRDGVDVHTSQRRQSNSDSPSATEKQMATSSIETTTASSSLYGSSASTSGHLLCTHNEETQVTYSESPATSAATQGKVEQGPGATAAVAAAADTGLLIPKAETGVVQSYAGNATAAALPVLARDAGARGHAFFHEPAAASAGAASKVEHQANYACAAGGRLTDVSYCGEGADCVNAAKVTNAADKRPVLLPYVEGSTCSNSGRPLASVGSNLECGAALRPGGSGSSSRPTSAPTLSGCGSGSSMGCESGGPVFSDLTAPGGVDSTWNGTNNTACPNTSSSSLGFTSSIDGSMNGNGLSGLCADGRREDGSEMPLSSGPLPSSNSTSGGMPSSSCSSMTVTSSSGSISFCPAGAGSNNACSSLSRSSICTRGSANGMGAMPGAGNSSSNTSGSADLLMRPGVSYYGGRQAWVAEIKYGGRRRFKVFSVAKYGYEGAKQMAAATREQWEAAREAGQLDQLMRSSQRHQCPVQSGVKGVYYDTARKGWRVVVTLNCRQMSKFFLASKFGNAEAKRLAIECRQMWLDAIRNGRADDVFEKARRLVSFKMKSAPPLNAHTKYVSLSPVLKTSTSSGPSPASSVPPSALMHCGNAPVANAGPHPVPALPPGTNGILPTRLATAAANAATSLSGATTAAAAAALSQSAAAAAATRGASHVLLPPLMAAAAAAAATGAAAGPLLTRPAPKPLNLFHSDKTSSFLLKPPAGATDTASSSTIRGNTATEKNTGEPLFSAAAAAARLAAAVAGTAAVQITQTENPGASCTAGIPNACSSISVRGATVSTTSRLSFGMLPQGGCSGPPTVTAAQHRAVASPDSAADHTTDFDPNASAWLRRNSNSSSSSNNDVFSSDGQQPPSLKLMHPHGNGILLNNSTGSTAGSSTRSACSSNSGIMGNSCGPIGAGSSSTVSTASNRCEDVAESTVSSPTPSSFATCLTDETPSTHMQPESLQPEPLQPDNQAPTGDQNSPCIAVSHCGGAPTTPTIPSPAQTAEQMPPAVGTPASFASLHGAIAAAAPVAAGAHEATASTREAPQRAQQQQQPFECGFGVVNHGCPDELGETCGRILAGEAACSPIQQQKQQQSQEIRPVYVASDDVSGTDTHGGSSHSFSLNPVDEGTRPLQQQKQWEEVSGEKTDSSGATTTTTEEPVAAGAEAATIDTENLAASAVASRSVNADGCHGGEPTSQQTAADIRVAEGIEAARGVAPAAVASAAAIRETHTGAPAEQAIPPGNISKDHGGILVPNSAAGATPSASGEDGAQLRRGGALEGSSTNNRQLQQQLQLLQGLRNSSFPLLDALWPSTNTAASAPLPIGVPVPNVASTDLRRGKDVALAGPCSAAADGGQRGISSVAGSGCSSASNSYTLQGISSCATTTAGSAPTHDKVGGAAAMPDKKASATDRSGGYCGELPRGSNMLSMLLQPPLQVTQLALQQQQQQFLAAAAAATSRPSAGGEAEGGVGKRTGAESNAQTDCEAAAPITSITPGVPSGVCGSFPGTMMATAAAAAAAALRPTSPWLFNPSPRGFLPGSAAAAVTAPSPASFPTEDDARGAVFTGRNTLSSSSSTSRVLLGGGASGSARRRAGVGASAAVAAAGGGGPLPTQNREQQLLQTAAASSLAAAAAASRVRPPQQRHSKDSSSIPGTTGAVGTGESSSSGSSSTCDVRGVYLDTRNNAWAATMGVHGRNVKKSFAVAKHGYETALQLAIHARRQLERIYWGENPPGSSGNSTSSPPPPPPNSPSQPSGSLRHHTPTTAPTSGSSSASPVSAETESNDGTNKGLAFAAESPGSHTPSAAPHLQLHRLQEHQQHLQQQFQRLAAAGGDGTGPPLAATSSSPLLNVFGPPQDSSAPGPSGLAAAVMGGASAVAAAGLVSSAAANLQHHLQQQQLRCAAAFQQQQLTRSAAPGGGLQPTQQPMCGWTSTPHAIENAPQDKGFYNGTTCCMEPLAPETMGGVETHIDKGRSSVGGGSMMAAPSAAGGCSGVGNCDSGSLSHNNAAVPANAAPAGGGEEPPNAEAATRLATTNTTMYPSPSSASPSTAPASLSTTPCRSSDSSPAGIGVEGARDELRQSPAAVGPLLGSTTPPPPLCSTGDFLNGNASGTNTLLRSTAAPAGSSGSAETSNSLPLLGSAMHGLTAARGYGVGSRAGAPSADSLAGINPTLLLGNYGPAAAGAPPPLPALLGGRNVESGSTAAAGAAAASFLAGAGGMLLGGGGIASLLCNNRCTMPAGEAAPPPSACPEGASAGEDSFMMQDALAALLLQLDTRQRNELLPSYPPHALLAAAGAAAGAAAARDGNATALPLPVLLQQQHLHGSLSGAQRRGLQQPPQHAMAGGPPAGLLLRPQPQQLPNQEQPQQEHPFQPQTHQQQPHQQQLLQHHHPSQHQQHRREFLPVDSTAQGSGGAPGGPGDSGEHAMLSSTSNVRNAGDSVTPLPYDTQQQQRTGGLEDSGPSAAAVTLHAIATQSSGTAGMWPARRQQSPHGVTEGDHEGQQHPPQQQIGGYSSASGQTGPAAQSIAVTDCLGDTVTSGGSNSSSVPGTSHPMDSNFTLARPPSPPAPLHARLEADAECNHSSSSGMPQPCAASESGKVERNAASNVGPAYMWNGGFTLLENGLMVGATTAGATTKDQPQKQQQQCAPVSNTYSVHGAVATSSGVAMCLENNKAP